MTDQEQIRNRLVAREPGPTAQEASSPWATAGTGLHSVTGIPAGGAGLDEFGRPPLSDLAKMRNSAMLAFGLSFIVSSVSRARWHIRCTDERRAAFVKEALAVVYPRLVQQWANALSFGYSPVVKSFERRAVDWRYVAEDGKERRVWTGSAPPIVWADSFAALNPRTARVHFDASGNFGGIDYRKPKTAFSADEAPDIPITHSLWFVCDRDAVFGSLYGYPRLARSYRHWWSSSYRHRLADRAFEKWADPPVVVRHPVDLSVDENGVVRDYSSEALAIAERLRSGANVSMPSSLVTSEIDGRVSSQYAWTIEQMKSEADFTALEGSFEYLDVLQLRSLLIPEQALIEGSGGTSSRNVAQVMGDALEESMASLLHEVYSQVNAWMIPQLLEVNFGAGGPTAEIVADSFDASDVETGRAIVQALAQNATAELSDVDTRALLASLKIPLRSAPGAEEARTRMAEEAKPPKSVQASEEELSEIERDAALLSETYEPPEPKRRTVVSIVRDAAGRITGTQQREVDDE